MSLSTTTTTALVIVMPNSHPREVSVNPATSEPLLLQKKGREIHAVHFGNRRQEPENSLKIQTVLNQKPHAQCPDISESTTLATAEDGKNQVQQKADRLLDSRKGTTQC